MKAAVRIHTRLALRGNIPTFIDISAGKLPAVNILDQLLPKAGEFDIMNRAYLDFERRHHRHRHGRFVVLRAKKNTNLRRRYSNPVNRAG